MIDGKAHQATGVVVPGHLMMVGGGEKPWAGAIARVGTHDEPAVDVAEALQAGGVVLIAAEAPSSQRARLKAVVLDQPKTNIVRAPDVDRACALAEARRRDEGKAQDVVGLGALELGGDENKATDLPGRAGKAEHIGAVLRASRRRGKQHRRARQGRTDQRFGATTQHRRILSVMARSSPQSVAPVRRRSVTSHHDLCA